MRPGVVVLHNVDGPREYGATDRHHDADPEQPPGRAGDQSKPPDDEAGHDDGDGDPGDRSTLRAVWHRGLLCKRRGIELGSALRRSNPIVRTLPATSAVIAPLPPLLAVPDA